ncbi:MAG: hypothetical protein IKN65_00835 [Clostridia bacterium]|nr:hypothetical protein [Bacilli bacterium]MBR3672829.1 hypothetical protein [Clostridia bacterium]
MACTKKIQIEDTIYTANVDFRIAIRCNEIAQDETIGDFERVLGIICTMFGADAIDNPNHYEKLLKWALNYLSCGQEIKDTHEEPDMDYVEDMDYIEASFMSDYQIDLENTEMDWQKFNKLINGLSNSEMGNCCVLNRVRNLRNYDTKDIKDKEERDKIIKAKEQVALKKYKKEKKIELTEKQQNSVDEFYKALGF